MARITRREWIALAGCAPVFAQPTAQRRGGEAGVVHRGGGRYMSVIGRNALFHNPGDRGPDAVDVATIARFAQMFTGVAQTLAAR